MTDDRLRSYGVLLLRLSLGTMFLAHSVIYMLLTLTLSGTSDFFNSIGLPCTALSSFFPTLRLGAAPRMSSIRSQSKLRNDAQKIEVKGRDNVEERNGQ